MISATGVRCKVFFSPRRTVRERVQGEEVVESKIVGDLESISTEM